MKINLYWEMNDSQLAELYQVGKADGALDLVIFDASVTLDLFCLFARRQEVFGAVYDHNNKPLGFFYLNTFEGASARLHFCTFKAARENRHEIGRKVLKWCFETFEFKSLIGAVPVIYSGACDYAREMGGREIGWIPGMCWIERLKRTVGALMFVFEPSEVK